MTRIVLDITLMKKYLALLLVLAPLAAFTQNLKISQLPVASTPLGGTELVPVVQGGVTKQTTVSAIGSTFSSGGGGSVTGTGAAHQLAYWSSTSALTGDANLLRTVYSLEIQDGSNLNTYLGFGVGNGSTTGADNLAVGNNSLHAITSGDDNVAIGAQTLPANTSGSFNIAINTSMQYNTTGSYNIAIGNAALTTNVTGSDNIAIGYLADQSIPANLSNTIALGQNAEATESNELVIVPSIHHYNLSGVDYFLPSAQGAANTILSNDGSGNLTWASIGSGGSGSVTSFSSGDLSPLFTTSVTNPTTTPSLAYLLSNAAAHTFLGNFTGSSAAPSYSSPSLASADFANQGTTTTVLHGNSSGNPSWAMVGLTTDVTGTLAITNGGTGTTSASAAINALLPSQSGNSGKYLITNGTSASWANVSGGDDGGGSAQWTFDDAFNSYPTGALSSPSGSENTLLVSTIVDPYSLTSGNQNVLVGDLTGYDLTSESGNTFIGSQAVASAGGISYCVAIGANTSLSGNGSTGYNVVIGANSSSASNESNQVILGADATATSISDLFYVSPTITNYNFVGIPYVFPSAQATAAGQVLTNDGSGNLSWANADGDGGTVYTTNQLVYGDGATAGGVTSANIIYNASSQGFAIDDNSNYSWLSVQMTSGSQEVRMGDIDGDGNSTILNVNDGTQTINLNASSVITMSPHITINSVPYNWTSTQAASPGQVLTNDGSGNLSWSNVSSGSSPLTTKGDIWGYNTTDARIPVGTNGQVLTANSSNALGVSWQTPAGAVPSDEVAYGTGGSITGNSGFSYNNSTLGQFQIAFPGVGLGTYLYMDPGITGFLYLGDKNNDYGTNELLTEDFGDGKTIFSNRSIQIGTPTYTFPSAQATSSGQVLTNDGTGNLNWNNPLPYTEYDAFISQSGTGAPTIDSVVYNNTGGTISYSYDATGTYNITISGASFHSQNRVMFFSTGTAGGLSSPFIDMVYTNNTTLTINTWAGSSLTNSILYHTPIKIQIY